MAELDNIAKKAIGNERYRDSLYAIGRFVERIWAPEVDRLVRGFTDHGPAHLLRVAGYAHVLRAINKSIRPTDEELFLLFGGVLLHDIGMQCDVTRRPEIIPIAEDLGACFTTDLTSMESTGYSVEQQADLRRNHGFLSAAWIEYARSDRDDAFHAASATIDQHLAEDMMDMCRYHTKLPIDECEHNGSVDHKVRKQLVAAMLRLADECDIDSIRVNMETPHTFAIDPENAMWWFLHGHTKLHLASNGLITLVVALNEKQIDLLSSAVRSCYIEKFAAKNATLLDVLARASLIIHFDASKSGVVKSRLATDLSADAIQSLLAADQQRRDDAVRLTRPANASAQGTISDRLWVTWDDITGVSEWKEAIREEGLDLVGISVLPAVGADGAARDVIILTVSDELSDGARQRSVGVDPETSMPVILKPGGPIELLAGFRKGLGTPPFVVKHVVAGRASFWTAGCWVRHDNKEMLLTTHPDALSEPDSIIELHQAKGRVRSIERLSGEQLMGELVRRSTETQTALIATTVQGPKRSQSIRGIGRLASIDDKSDAYSSLARRDQVRMHGAESGLTFGEVTGLMSIAIRHKGVTRLDKVLELTPQFERHGNMGFGAQGDSGAVVVNDRSQVIGVLIARSTGVVGRGYAVPISFVTEALDCSVIADRKKNHTDSW